MSTKRAATVDADSDNDDVESRHQHKCAAPNASIDDATTQTTTPSPPPPPIDVHDLWLLSGTTPDRVASELMHDRTSRLWQLPKLGPAEFVVRYCNTDSGRAGSIDVRAGKPLQRHATVDFYATCYVAGQHVLRPTSLSSLSIARNGNLLVADMDVACVHEVKWLGGPAYEHIARYHAVHEVLNARDPQHFPWHVVEHPTNNDLYFVDWPYNDICVYSRQYDIQSDKLTTRFRHHFGEYDKRANGRMHSLVFSADGRRLVVTQDRSSRVLVYFSDHPNTEDFTFGETTPEHRLQNAGGIACNRNDGSYIVADTEAGVLRHYDVNGVYLRQIPVRGTLHPFYNPMFVAVDADGKILVTDNDNDTLNVLAPDGTHLCEMDTTYSREYAGTIGVSIDCYGRVFTSDFTSRISVWK